MEKKVYERIGSHPLILKYLGQSPPEHPYLKSSLLFEYFPRDSLEGSIKKLRLHAHERQRQQHQAAAALAHIHSLDIVNGDFGIHNFLRCDSDDIMLFDFAGSGLDDLPCLISPKTRYCNPPALYQKSPTKRDDVFSLGTVLYEIERGEVLWEICRDHVIHDFWQKGRFPVVSDISMPLRGVTTKCWIAPEYTASEAAKELEPKK